MGALMPFPIGALLAQLSSRERFRVGRMPATRGEETMMGIVEESSVPAAEIEAAADALKVLWESEENQRSFEKTGLGLTCVRRSWSP